MFFGLLLYSEERFSKVTIMRSLYSNIALFSLAVTPLIGTASSINIDKIFPHLDKNFDLSGSKVGYGARLVRGSQGDDTLVFGPTDDSTEFIIAYNTEVSDNFSMRAYTTLLPDNGSLSNNESGIPVRDAIAFHADQYGVFLISPKWGIFSLGRLRSPTSHLARSTALNSGVNQKYFTDVGGVVVMNDYQDMNYRIGSVQLGDNYAPLVGGEGLILWGYGPSDGNRLLDSVGYIYPTDRFELRMAYSNQNDSFYSPSFEATASYLYDLVYARSNFMVGYATKWPYAGQMKPTVLDTGVGTYVVDSDEVSFKSPYQLFQIANKTSVGDIDLTLSFSSLFGNDQDDSVTGSAASELSSRVNQWYFAADYTFIDLVPYGPLSVGIGYTQRTDGFNAVEAPLLEDNYVAFYEIVNAYAQDMDLDYIGVDKVQDSRNEGFMIALHQRFGPRAGVKLYFENLNFYSDNVTNSTAETARTIEDKLGDDVQNLPIGYQAVLSELASWDTTYALDAQPINAWVLSFYVKI